MYFFKESSFIREARIFDDRLPWSTVGDVVVIAQAERPLALYRAVANFATRNQ